MVLSNDLIVVVLDKHHRLSVLRSLHQTTHMALQVMSDKISVSYISREDETLLSALEIIVLSDQSNSLVMFRRDTPLIDLVHCVMSTSVMFELKERCGSSFG